MKNSYVDNPLKSVEFEDSAIQLSGATLLSEHSPSWASKIKHFKIFSCPQQNQLTWQFFIKFNLLLFFLIS